MIPTKAILFYRPSRGDVFRNDGQFCLDNTIVQFAGHVRHLCKEQQIQLYVKMGEETRNINVDDIYELIYTLTDSKNVHEPIMLYTRGRHAEAAIELLYKELLFWEARISDCEKKELRLSKPPELIKESSSKEMNMLDFSVADTEGSEKTSDLKNEPIYELQCRMICDESENIENIILFAADFRCSRESEESARLAKELCLRSRNTAVISFDWPCHGDILNEVFRLQTCTEYLKRLTGFVRRRYSPKAVSVYAVGFGAFITLRYIHEVNNSFDRIVLRKPIFDMYDTFIHRVLTDAELASLIRGNNICLGPKTRKGMVILSKSCLKEFQGEDIELESFAEFQDNMIILDDKKNTLQSSPAAIFAAVNAIRYEQADQDAALQKAAFFFLDEEKTDWEDDAPIVRKGLVFHGNVQGVGFRWRALAFATDVKASGWVRKDCSGTVTMEIQGTEARIHRVLDRLERVPDIQIDWIDEENLAVIQGDQTFQVKPNQQYEPAEKFEEAVCC